MNRTRMADRAAMPGNDLAVIEGLSLILLLGLSAFFSGSETALVALSRARADALADD